MMYPGQGSGGVKFYGGSGEVKFYGLRLGFRGGQVLWAKVRVQRRSSSMG